MKKTLMIVSLCLSSVVLTGCMEKKVDLTKKEQKESYSFGYNIGKNLSLEDDAIDLNVLVKGMKDGFNNDGQLTEKEMQEVLVNFQKEQQEKEMERLKMVAEKNKEAASVFLAENKAKDGVVTRKSGLQYKVLEKGAGKKSPSKNDTVVVHYAGRLIDGTEFDSSYKRNTPAEFPVNAVIEGWTEVLQLMTPGDKWEVYVPSELAYGTRGAGASIGPNSLLIFDIELIDVK